MQYYFTSTDISWIVALFWRCNSNWQQLDSSAGTFIQKMQHCLKIHSISIGSTPFKRGTVHLKEVVSFLFLLLLLLFSFHKQSKYTLSGLNRISTYSSDKAHHFLKEAICCKRYLQHCRAVFKLAQHFFKGNCMPFINLVYMEENACFSWRSTSSWHVFWTNIFVQRVQHSLKRSISFQ